MIYKYKNRIEITNIKSLRFSYSTGTMIYSNVSYELKLENDKYIGIIKPNNVPDENKITIEMKDEDIEKIRNILIKYKVQNWDGFQKSDKYVMGGNSFSIFINFIEGKSISASGYMMYPNNYREVANELDNIFLSYYK